MAGDGEAVGFVPDLLNEVERRRSGGRRRVRRARAGDQLFILVLVRPLPHLLGVGFPPRLLRCARATRPLLPSMSIKSGTAPPLTPLCDSADRAPPDSGVVVARLALANVIARYCSSSYRCPHRRRRAYSSLAEVWLISKHSIREADAGNPNTCRNACSRPSWWTAYVPRLLDCDPRIGLGHGQSGPALACRRRGAGPGVRPAGSTIPPGPRDRSMIDQISGGTSRLR